MEKNLYELGESEAEKERLKKFEYPFYVSKKAIGDNIKGKTILDVGAGPNTALGKWAKEKTANYIALDVTQDFLKEHKAAGSGAVRATIEQIPFTDNSLDVTHTRFVLIHLPPERREQAIKEIIRVTKERALFLEFDWFYFKGGETVNRFRDLAIAASKVMGIDVFLSQKLKDQIADVAGNEVSKITETVFTRVEGEYYPELIMFARTVKMAVERFKDKFRDSNIPRELSKTLDELEIESKKEHPEKFMPPAILVVEAAK